MRVVTYNIHHGVGLDDRLDLDRVADVLRQLAPDVVGLQEVDRHLGPRSAYADQAGELASRLEMDVAYGACVDRDPSTDGGPRRQYGCALLSRYPLEEPVHTLLPRTGNREQRGVLSARVRPDGRPVRVYVTHLEQSSRQERRTQVQQLLGEVTGAGGPAVLVGDLNASPWSGEVRSLTGALADSWPEAGDGRGYTHRADRPLRRIDYVLHTADLVAASAEVVRSTASDHLPVTVDLELPVRRGAD